MISTTISPSHPSAGCRVSSPEYRHSTELCQHIAGLEEGINRYDLLLLIKRVGSYAGFTPRQIQLLDYYLAFTRDCDWEEGARPIVYQSISRTALDLGVSERQVQKLEQGLFQLGAITWNDSGNYKRYGQRDAVTGRIKYAYGVELTPLAALKQELEKKLAEKQRYDQSWMETKRQISWYRSQIRATLQELREEGAQPALLIFEQRYDQIAVQLRTSLDLDKLTMLLQRHRDLLSDLTAALEGGSGKREEGAQRASSAEKTANCSASNETKFVHKESTTQESFNELNTEAPTGPGLQERLDEPLETKPPTADLGLQHVTIGMAVHAASERFRDLLPLHPGWPDLVEAAYVIRRELKISQSSWAEACQALGRTGATLCVLVTDQACLRTEDPVRQPAGYFRAMIDRARCGELQLHRSIFGLLKRADCR
ncbi:plasmid replication protein RepC [Rubinisphaera margarita]|uniref:plasmid replication protein RepC n=1 Tax=Rubinisphaera margarita TaxID=2909586 RepID=UPI001EE898CB|nr:plasmid replication protein RepC [Rubinisphaera margarita]MCG6157629.1 hypothetical protein [Rubinisphaera margarita]